jgi:hypothetical protein
MTDNTQNWDELGEAMETMAKAVGAQVVLKDKYGSLRVEFPQLPENDEHTKALYVFADLIETASATSA